MIINQLGSTIPYNNQSTKVFLMAHRLICICSYMWQKIKPLSYQWIMQTASTCKQRLTETSWQIWCLFSWSLAVSITSSSEQQFTRCKDVFSKIRGDTVLRQMVAVNIVKYNRGIPQREKWHVGPCLSTINVLKQSPLNTYNISNTAGFVNGVYLYISYNIGIPTYIISPSFI